MNKTVEADIIEYIYERLVKLMLPVSQMPIVFQGFIAPLMAHYNTPVTAILPFNRFEFELIIQLLLGFERHTKSNAVKSAWNKATPLSRRSYANAQREHNKKYDGLCHNHTRLCETVDLLNSQPDDFIGYLTITCVKLRNPLRSMMDGQDENDENLRVNIPVNEARIEFGIGLAGFDLFGKNDKQLPNYERKLVIERWEQYCADHKYFTDFSLLINKSGANGIIFLMDHTTFLK